MPNKRIPKDIDAAWGRILMSAGFLSYIALGIGEFCNRDIAGKCRGAHQTAVKALLGEGLVALREGKRSRAIGHAKLAVALAPDDIKR